MREPTYRCPRCSDPTRVVTVLVSERATHTELHQHLDIAWDHRAQWQRVCHALAGATDDHAITWASDEEERTYDLLIDYLDEHELDGTPGLDPRVDHDIPSPEEGR
jgi:hypothetical protein